MKVFVSYANEDIETFHIKKIVKKLENTAKYPEINKVYYWHRDVPLGLDFNEYMRDNISSSDVCLVICSENSSTAEGVILERGMMIALGKRIIPIFKEDEHVQQTLRENLRGVQLNRVSDDFIDNLYKKLTGKEPKKSSIKAFYKEFWDNFIKHNKRNDTRIYSRLPRSTPSKPYIYFTTGIPDMTMGLVLTARANQLRCELIIKDNLELFDKLYEKKEEIGRVLLEYIEWERNYGNNNNSRIRIFNDVQNIQANPKNSDFFDWFIEKSVKMLDVFGDFVNNL
ncbi:MAG: DUF4268 domain-containing protein [Candidatus Delongbacteria bacterium]|nr:DUF4268 domain-containing protein [Candidatus Delongbacteria bacterium]